MRLRRVLVASVVVLSAGLGAWASPPAGAASAPAPGAGASPPGAGAAGPGAGAAGPDLGRLCARLQHTPAKTPLCTHGPDTLHAFQGRDALTAAPEPAAPAQLAALCRDGGVSGRRVEVLYGVPKDRPNRYGNVLLSMQSVLAEVDADLDASDADTEQHYRFLCENGVDVTIRNVTLLPVGTDASFTWNDYVRSLQEQVALGLGPTNFVRDDRVYLTFVDQITTVYPYGGQGSIYTDDSPDPATNANNTFAKYSMTAYYDAHVVGHELGHNIGAVQNTAPHASGGFHCHDGNDLMCYADGGSYFANGGVMTQPCTGSGNLMDCGQDDYYHPGTPPAGSYLSTHWNTADSGYLTPLAGTRTAPSAPTAVAAVQDGATTATLSWSPPSSDGGSAITGYRVTGGGTSTLLAATARSHRFSGLVAGTTYSLSVQAVNAVGTGAAAARSVTMTSSGARTEESAPTVEYNGWRGVTDPAANGGAYRSSSVTGGTAAHTFTGTSLTWLTRRGPGQGIASVTIDGVSKGNVDLYASTTGSLQKSFTGLAATRHKVVIKVTGTRNAASTGTAVSVDGFTVGTATVQESAKAVTYNTWVGASSTSASGGQYRVSGSAQASAVFRFTGTEVTWITATGPGWGRARVVLDGVDKGVVDLYATTASWQTARTYGGLAAGAHTLTISPLGTKDAAATSTKVPIDAFSARG